MKMSMFTKIAKLSYSAVFAMLTVACGGGGGNTESVGAAAPATSLVTQTNTVVPFVADGDVIFQSKVTKVPNDLLLKLQNATGQTATFSNLTTEEIGYFVKGKILVFDTESMVLLDVVTSGNTIVTTYRQAGFSEIYKKFKLKLSGSVPANATSGLAAMNSHKSLGFEKISQVLNARKLTGVSAKSLLVEASDSEARCTTSVLNTGLTDGRQPWQAFAVNCSDTGVEGRKLTVSGKVVFNSAPTLEPADFDVDSNVLCFDAVVGAIDQAVSWWNNSQPINAECASGVRINTRIKADITTDLQVNANYELSRSVSVPLYALELPLPASLSNKGVFAKLGLFAVIDADGEVTLSLGMINDYVFDTTVDNSKSPSVTSNNSMRVRTNADLTVTASITPAVQLVMEAGGAGRRVSPIDAKVGLKLSGVATGTLRLDSTTPANTVARLCGNLSVYRYVNVASDFSGIGGDRYSIYELPLTNPIYSYSPPSNDIFGCDGPTEPPLINATPKYRNFIAPGSVVLFDSQITSALEIVQGPTWSQVHGAAADFTQVGGALTVYTNRATANEPRTLQFVVTAKDSLGRFASDTVTIGLVPLPTASNTTTTSTTGDSVAVTTPIELTPLVPVINSVYPTQMSIGVATDITVDGKNLPTTMAMNIAGHTCANDRKRYVSSSKVIFTCIAGTGPEMDAKLEVKWQVGVSPSHIDNEARTMKIRWAPATLSSISPIDSFRADTLQPMKAFGKNLLGALTIDETPGRLCTVPKIVSSTQAHFDCSFSEPGTSNITIRSAANRQLLISRSVSVLRSFPSDNSTTMTFNVAPVIGGLKVNSPLSVNEAVAGNFEVSDVNGDQVTNLRVHVSKVNGESDCQIDVGNFAGIQPTGGKSFSGCASLTAIPGVLYIKVEARDSKGAQAVVKNTSTEVVAGPIVPILVSGLAGSQSSAGAPINGSFSIAGSTVSLVRVHAGTTALDTWCYIDLAASTGAKSFSFQGNWTNQNGKTCSALLPAPGASANIVFKVEARDATGSLANAGTAPEVGITYTSLNNAIIISSVTPVSGRAGTTVTVTVNGANLPATLAMNIDGQSTGCMAMTRGSTQALFTCGLNVTGTRLLEIKTNTAANGGVVIASPFNAFTVDPALPQVTGITPGTGSRTVPTTFTILGTNLPSTLALDVAGLACDNVNKPAYNQVTCQASTTVGTRTATVKSAPGGAVLYTGSVSY